jgi:hypothetical protein
LKRSSDDVLRSLAGFTASLVAIARRIMRVAAGMANEVIS